MGNVWTVQPSAYSGQYLRGVVTSGFDLTFFNAVSMNEIEDAARQRANGWTVLKAAPESGPFGLTGAMTITGVATADVDTLTVGNEMADAINAFWQIMGASVTVSVSNSPEDPTETEWASTLKWAAIAVLAVCIVYGVIQIRRISE